MISFYTHIDWNEVENLYITEYKSRLEQAQNIMNANRGAKFEYIDSADRKKDFIEEIEYFKQQGRLN